MARVRLVAQGIDDPEIEAGEERPGRLGDVGDIGDIGEWAEAEAECGRVAVPDRQGGHGDLAPRTADGEAAVEQVETEDRRIFRPLGLNEGIAEAMQKRVRRRGIGPDLKLAMGVVDDHPEIVDPMGMVGVVMGVDHRVKLSHACVEQLRAQVG